MLFYTESPLKFAFSNDKAELTKTGFEKAETTETRFKKTETTETRFKKTETKKAGFKFHPSKSELKEGKRKFGILGVPFDGTTTYKPGARFGPLSVREASYNLERYNLFLDKNLDVPLYDLGDLEVVHGNFKKTCSHLKSTVKELSNRDITPVAIGGEHTISYGIVNALKIRDATIICFDAHLDLRDEYMGEKYSHATVMRRIFDLNPENMIQIGIRSCSEAEATFASTEQIEYYTSPDVRKDLKGVENYLSTLDGPLYVTVDIDVLDPAYAPSVGTPVPGGLTPPELQKLIYSLKGKEVIGFDLVEISSNQMGDITSINGAQILYDFLCLQ
jgi:agmatinase